MPRRDNRRKHVHVGDEPPTLALMNYAQLERDAQAVMNRLAPIDVSQKVGDLPISSQQLVEIAKRLTLDCRGAYL